METEGHCTCGAVRYTLELKPLFTHACHCSWCQRESGSALIINALIEKSAIRVTTGTTEETLTPTASGKGQRIHRCTTCKIALWSHYAYGKISDLVAFVRVGTLETPDKIPPDIHIFAESKMPWLTLTTSVPVVPGFYKASEYWPEDSLRRRALLFESAT